MSEIKVGEYLRLYNGMIVKWGEKQDTRIIGSAYLDCSGEYEWSCSIVKHSFNIIDLIEEGDYVNGKEITSVSKYQDKKVVCYTEETYGGISYHIFNKDIKSIVTKEMMESVEYRLEE